MKVDVPDIERSLDGFDEETMIASCSQPDNDTSASEDEASNAMKGISLKTRKSTVSIFYVCDIIRLFAYI